MTRGRLGNLAWIPEPTGRAGPAEALAEAICRPPNASTAHATRDRLHRPADVAPPAETQSHATPEEPAARAIAQLDAVAATARSRAPLGR